MIVLPSQNICHLISSFPNSLIQSPISIDGAAAVISKIAIMVMTITIKGAAIGRTNLAPPTTAVVDRTIVIAIIVMAAVVEVVVKAGAG